MSLKWLNFIEFGLCLVLLTITIADGYVCVLSFLLLFVKVLYFDFLVLDHCHEHCTHSVHGCFTLLSCQTALKVARQHVFKAALINILTIL